MRVVNITQFEDGLVLHFETDGERINAYTLASTLVSIADAAKAANSSINIGYDVEIVVEALGPGSFRAKIRAVYAKARNLFSDQLLKGVVLAIVANYIYERTLSVDDAVNVEIKTDEVIIERGDDRIIVPRFVYDATRNAEKNPQFVRAVQKTMEAVRDDDHVTSFGFVDEMDSPPPEIRVPRTLIEKIWAKAEDEPLTRIISEQCDLQILKAILEKSRRKWEFVWGGFKISAPILDDRFYADFTAHDITIAPGDVLRVRLSINEICDQKTRIYTNVGYVVTEVFEHVPGIRQDPLDFQSHD